MAGDANGIGEGDARGIAVGGCRFTGSGRHQRAEVIHDEFNENLLTKEITSDGMRGIEAEVVFKIEERSFDAPAKVIKFLQVAERAAATGEISDKEFAIAIIKPDTNETELETEDRGLIVRGDEIEATPKNQFTALQRGEIAKRFYTSGEEEFGIELVFILVRVSEMAERGDGAIRVFEANEEELVIHGDCGHGIEGVEAAVGDKETRTGDRIAVYKGDAGIVFIEESTRLNDGVDIAIFEDIERSDGMELMIAAIFGVIGDEGIGVLICRDVEVGTVAGEKMQAEPGFSEWETRIKAFEQGGEEIVIELGALANESGGGWSGMQWVFGIADVEEAVNFTADRAFLHGHHEQDQILEWKATATGKIPTGVEDKAVQILLHSVDSVKERTANQSR